MSRRSVIASVIAALGVLGAGWQLGGGARLFNEPVDIGGPYTDGVHTGDMSSNAFGTWQISITVVEERLVEIEVETNADDQRSLKINEVAVPQLRASAIKAQSAEINTISGATLTSKSYLTSLQSALDKAAS